jgi:CO/xanthine dehydrogenase Mo-binding subunit
VTSPERLDGKPKVTGAARYAADIQRPGMLHGRILRSPVAHARIAGIRVEAAREVPGVRAVLVGADIKLEVRVGRNMRDMPVLARDKVRFIGEKVAAVAAESAEIAEHALRLIDVEYEQLPAVFNPIAAMQPGAPLIHDPASVRAWAEPEQIVPNYPNGVAAPAWGASEDEVRTALARADMIFEHTFHTANQHQAYLEPHVCIVEVDPRTGIAQIWASNKAPLLLARYLRDGLGLERHEIDIHMLPLGGDFGGKGSFMDIPLAYFLSRASGRPVKMLMSYADELIAGNPRHASCITIQSGVMHDGRIVARWLRGYVNSGAYAAFKPAPDTTLPGFRRGAIGPYAIPVQRSECHMVYTNTVPGGHMRSPGEAQTAYAVECHTDLIARALGMDPIQLRIMHGSTTPRNGSAPPIEELLRSAAHAIGMDRPRSPDVGCGVALLEFTTSPGIYSGILSIQRDGHVTLQTPIIENGAGALTVFRQLVAEEFGVLIDNVSVAQSIDDIDVDRGVGGSRTTRLVGKVVHVLASKLQARLAQLLAAEFGLSTDDLHYEAGVFATPDGRTWPLAAAASLATSDLVEKLTYSAGSEDRSVVFMAQAAEVRVDRETGQVQPLRLVSVHEVGRVVNPMLFQTQIAGGVLQGLGFALMEGLLMEDGRVTNAGLHEYKIPTLADAPELQTILLAPNLSLGLTPIGEGANAGTAPAIVNAVMDVIGAHALDVPLQPERIRQLAPSPHPSPRAERVPRSGG